MDIRVINVRGDGHCYYRCLWNIAKNVPKVAEALMVYDLTDEKEGAEEIRYYIALSIRRELYAQGIVRNLVELYKDIPDLQNEYPVLKYISNVNGDWISIYNEVSNAIENTNVMASSLEHEIIVERLCDTVSDPPLDCKLFVLTQTSRENKEDLSDKWLRDLHAALENVDNDYVIVLINEDNIHYKYTKILGKIMIETTELKEFINGKMEVTTEEESSDNEDDIL